MKTTSWIALFLIAIAGTALGQSPQQVKKQAEASIVVTGHVDVEADGSVKTHVIQGRSRLPDYVVELVDNAAAQWRFEPVLVDGEPVPARARMNLRLVAKPVGDGYEVSIASGSFGEYSDTATDRVTSRGMSPPRYPADMVRSGVEGTVYLLLKVGRDGSVEDVIAERVNLGAYAQEREMERMRRSFANRSLNAARDWTFNPPSTGSRVDQDYWVIRIPVNYSLSDGTASARTWQQYVPGPLHSPPEWLEDSTGSSGSDAMLAGSVQMVGGERRLLTPLGDG